MFLISRGRRGGRGKGVARSKGQAQQDWKREQCGEIVVPHGEQQGPPRPPPFRGPPAARRVRRRVRRVAPGLAQRGGVVALAGPLGLKQVPQLFEEPLERLARPALLAGCWL